MLRIKPNTVAAEDIEAAFDDLHHETVTFVLDDIGEWYMKLRIPGSRGASETLYELVDLNEGTLDFRLVEVLTELIETPR